MKSIYSCLKSYLLVVLLAGCCSSAKAQNWDQIVKMATGDLPGYRKSGSQFGRSVAISGNYAVVGAYAEKEGSGEVTSGAAYILFNDSGTWKVIKRLSIPTDEFVTRTFGTEVSISGDDLAITASDSQGKYSVFMFGRNQGGSNNWGLITKISSPDPYYIAQSFANAISLSGDYLAVASYLDADGSVHIYKRNQGGTSNWGYLKKPAAPHSENYQDYFGISICLSGDRLIVGAPAENEDLTESNGLDNAGGAYIYRSGKGGTDNWGLMSKVIAQTRAANDNFGSSVSINGDHAIVGAWKEDQDAQETATLRDAGAAYIFKKESSNSDNWIQMQKLTASERKTYESFGRKVSIFGNVAVVSDVSSPGQDISNYFLETGSVHIFKIGVGGADNWGLVKEISEPVPDFNNYFGKAFALSDQHLLVGAQLDDTDGNDENKLSGSGSVYIYERNRGGTENWGLAKKETRTVVDRKINDQFGYQVAISGNYAVVGAPGEDEDENGIDTRQDTGAAYILENKSGKWVFIKKLVDPLRASKRFGTAVSIFGEDVLIGSRYTETDLSGQDPLFQAGAAYIFSKNQGGNNNWGLVQKIIHNERQAGDRFGSSVALASKYLIIGCSKNEFEKSATIYKKDINTNQWHLTSTVSGDERGGEFKFGVSVSITDDYASVVSGKNISIFKRNLGGNENWEKVQVIAVRYDITEYEDEYGTESNATLNGNILVVGAPFFWPGVVFIYSKDQSTDHWSLVKELNPPAVENSFFGMSVSMSGDNILLGAGYPDFNNLGQDPVSNSGSAYLYSKDKGGPNNWGLVEQFTQPTRTEQDRFGSNVSISGNYFLVGAPLEDEDARELNKIDNAGATYIFRRTDGPVTSMEIPAQQGEYKSDYTIKEGNLTHYCTQNYLLLTLEHNGSGASIPADAVNFKIGNGANYFTGSTGFLAGTSGSAVINRWWNVDPLTQPSSNFKVRVYYTQQDFEAINSALQENGKNALTGESQMFFYKVKDNALGPFPDVKDVPADKVQVITNGTVAGLTTWKMGIDQGNKYAEFLVSSFSGGGVGGTSTGSPLPVTLTEFKGIKQENQVRLEWETSSETNSDYFEIQKSQDAQKWNPLTRVKAYNKGNGTQYYRVIDENPLPNKSFYRLKITDLDGSFAYSRILGVDFNIEDLVMIYPNPVSDRIFVTGAKSTSVESIQLINSSGQMVSKTKMSADGMQTTQFSPGLYTLRIIRNDGTQYSTKVMITH